MEKIIKKMTFYIAVLRKHGANDVAEELINDQHKLIKIAEHLNNLIKGESNANNKSGPEALRVNFNKR